MTTPTPPNQPQYPPQQPYGQGPQQQFPQQPGQYQQQQPGGPYQQQPGGPYQQPQGGFPPPGQGGPMPPVGPPASRPAGAKIKSIVGVVGAIGLVIVVILGFMASRKSPDSAKAGDCVARDGSNSVKKVACTDPDAAFKVLGKVDKQSETAFRISSERICKPFNGTTSAFWKGEQGKDGYVLCLSKLK